MPRWLPIESSFNTPEGFSVRRKGVVRMDAISSVTLIWSVSLGMPTENVLGYWTGEVMPKLSVPAVSVKFFPFLISSQMNQSHPVRLVPP